jgi:hypothetical protein
MAHGIILAGEYSETVRLGTMMLFRLSMARQVTPHVLRILESTVADGTLVGFFLRWIVDLLMVSTVPSVISYPHGLYAVVSLYAGSCLEACTTDRADMRACRISIARRVCGVLGD